ncbi:MAG: adaptor protein MecA [Dorea sp.]|nr:adaptor protein MecA [Dorea sp.]
MRIEKINENQIRCTLTRADLEERQLHLSELAYGSEKAKTLFRDMMQQAAQDFGFEVNDMPLMIEAIPSSSDSITLIITKVEDPEELDTRFSKFAPSPAAESVVKETAAKKLDGADMLKDLLERMKKSLETVDEQTNLEEGSLRKEPEKEEASSNDNKNEEKTEDAQPESPIHKIRLISFGTMEGVMKAARLIDPLYKGANTLYKDQQEGIYLLALTKSSLTDLEFNRICNMISEYGSLEHHSGPILAFLEEHCEVIIASEAVKKLASI